MEVYRCIHCRCVMRWKLDKWLKTKLLTGESIERTINIRITGLRATNILEATETSIAVNWVVRNCKKTWINYRPILSWKTCFSRKICSHYLLPTRSMLIYSIQKDLVLWSLCKPQKNSRRQRSCLLRKPRSTIYGWVQWVTPPLGAFYVGLRFSSIS